MVHTPRVAISVVSSVAPISSTAQQKDVYKKKKQKKKLGRHPVHLFPFTPSRTFEASLDPRAFAGISFRISLFLGHGGSVELVDDAFFVLANTWRRLMCRRSWAHNMARDRKPTFRKKSIKIPREPLLGVVGGFWGGLV